MDDTQQKAELHDEIGIIMERVMEAMGGGTLLIPDEVQRGLMETANPTLDIAGLRTLRDDLQQLAERHGAG